MLTAAILRLVNKAVYVVIKFVLRNENIKLDNGVSTNLERQVHQCQNKEFDSSLNLKNFTV